MKCLYSKADPLPTTGHQPEVWASPACVSNLLPARKGNLASWDVRQADKGSGGAVRSQINTGFPVPVVNEEQRRLRGGKHMQLASRKPSRHFHMHYAIYFCDDTKRLVLLTSFSRLENCSSKKADHLSVKKAFCDTQTHLLSITVNGKVSGFKPSWWQVGNLGCFALFLWVSLWWPRCWRFISSASM